MTRNVGAAGLIALMMLWLAALLGWAWLHLPQLGEHAQLHVAIDGQPGARHQVFHAPTPAFSESASTHITAGPDGVAAAAQRLARADLAFVRVDPGTTDMTRLCRLEIALGGGRHVGADEFSLVRTKQVAGVRQEDGCLVIQPEAGADDPYLVLEAPASVLDSGTRGWRQKITGALLATAFGLTALLVVITLRRAPPGVAVGRIADIVHRRLPAIYLALGLTFGSGYLLLTPPGAVADELAHATKAVKVGHGAMGATGDRLFPNLYHMYGEFNGFRSPSTRFTWAQLRSRAGAPVLCEGTTSNLPTGADSYGSHLYAVPALVYRAACASGAPFGVFIWASRFGNLAIALLLTAFGIWCSHRARWPLLVIALMPMSIYQMASLSADAVYFGLCFAWLGLTAGLAEGRVSARRAAPALIALVVMLTFSKPGGAWILGSMLFLRPAFLRDYARFWPALVAYLVVPAIAHAAWVLAAGSNAVPLAGVDPEFNLARLASDPLGVAKLFIAAYTGGHGWAMLRSMMGVLGWLDILLPAWAYTTILGCLLASLFLDRSGTRISRGNRAMATCFALGSVLMLSLPLYLYWTPPDNIRLGGLQGRYFIPSFAFAWAWLSMAAPRALQNTAILTIPIAMTLPLLHGLLGIAQRYYPI